MIPSCEVSPSGPALTGVEQLIPEFALPFEFVGKSIGEYSTLSALCVLADQVSDSVPYWVVVCGEQADALLSGLPADGFDTLTTSEATSPGSRGSSMVRVVGPDDRLAMLPSPRELDTARPWCVPQALLEELDRLVGQPESAQWASQVRNQLHALTDREQLEGDDVQIILADLSDAAQEAARMADEIDNDRLRVGSYACIGDWLAGWIAGA